MKHNILVFPCGSEIGLEIHRSLKFTKDIEIFGGSSTDDHGRFVYENYIPNIPFVENSNFISYLNKIVAEFKIDYIFPAHDSVVLKLAQNKDRINTKVVISPVKTCEITRSKRKTYEYLKSIVKIPFTHTLLEKLDYPLFLKPDIGQGSRGTLKVDTSEEVKLALKKDNSLLILEYLPGDEYTIDCFTDKTGGLLFCQARKRARVSNGISVNSKIVDDPVFKEIAQKVNSVLDFRGVWFFQLKKDTKEQLTLLEVAPRVAGTMALCRMQGANLPLLSLYDAMGKDVSIFINSFNIEIDRALTSKYKIDIEYDTVYIDLDDTIILEDRSNYLLIGLLYKFIEENKKIVLITKHLKAVEKTLEKHKVSEMIFDKIITLKEKDRKSDFMAGNAIFIDDSFAERKVVYENLNIPVFDVSEAVELL